MSNGIRPSGPCGSRLEMKCIVVRCVVTSAASPLSMFANDGFVDAVGKIGKSKPILFFSLIKNSDGKFWGCQLVLSRCSPVEKIDFIGQIKSKALMMSFVI